MRRPAGRGGHPDRAARAGDVLARDLHGLPVLRAAHVRGRHAAPGARHLRGHARRPPAPQGDPHVRPVAERLRDHPVALSLPGQQVIPPFSLWWIGMVHDYAMWRDDLEFVADRMPGVRAVLEYFRSCVNADGLLAGRCGWNFVDWVPGWLKGMPPDAEFGMNGIINRLAAWVFRLAAEVEEMLGENELAARNRRTADRLAAACRAVFWCEPVAASSRTTRRTSFSEHAQCLALLGASVPPGEELRLAERLTADPGLVRTTIYFSHYLFEAYRQIGRMDLFFVRLGLWFDLLDRGLKTVVEMPEPTRSDCHAWGAHPVFHLYAGVMGIQPAGPGFRAIRIRPQPGPLTALRGHMVHPRGEIGMDLVRRADGWHGRVWVPEGTPAVLELNGRSMEWSGGATDC